MYSSLSPKIIPILSHNNNITEVVIDPNTIIRTRTKNVLNEKLNIEIKAFIDGLNIYNQKYYFLIKNNKSQKSAISKKFSFIKHGYLEIYVSANSPIFKRVIPEPGYAILKIKDSLVCKLILPAECNIYRNFF